ncbi:cytochrome P450, partial [Mycena leptocephala]
YAGSIILRFTYGYETAPQDDKCLVLAEKSMAAFSLAAQPGTWAVDFLPWLRYLPSWLPGTGFKQKAASWHQLHREASEGPFHWALDNKDSPDLVQPNFMSTFLADSPNEPSAHDQDLLMWASASLFGGTTSLPSRYRGGVVYIFLAMALYPDVQATAQAEIAKVLTKGRIPQLSDCASLPYVECFMRWNPIGPLGFIYDDVYKDYHIPAGSIVMTNVWLILRHPGVFPNPQEFQPARFLNDPRAVEVASSIFGFGRRACPGAYFAEATMFIAIATVLAQCSISDPVDDLGSKLSKDVELQPGTIWYVQIFAAHLPFPG